MRLALALIPCVLIAAVACREKSAPPRAELGPESSASASAKPVPSALPTSSVTEPTALSVERPRQSRALKVALSAFPPQYQGFYGRGVFDVHSVRGGTVVTLGEALYALERGKLTEVPIEVGAQSLNGMMIGPLYAELGKVAGRYPGELWVTAGGMWVSDGARIHSAWSGTYRQRDSAWLEVGSVDLDTLAGWSGGRTVALRGDGFEIVAGSKKEPAPARTPGKSGSPRVAVESLAALPSGDLYALGSDSERGGSYSIERWSDADSRAASIHALPSWFCSGGSPSTGSSKRVTLVAGSPSSVFALCRGKLEAGLFRFDGKELRAVAPPVTGALTGAAAGADGSLWLVTKSRALTLTPEGVWIELVPPSADRLKSTIVEGVLKPEGTFRLELTSISATGAGRALVAGSLYDAASQAQRTFLFTSDDTALSMPETSPPVASASASTSASPPVGDAPSAEGAPLGPDCKTPFVVLYSVSNAAPADYAYPATRDALASANPRPSAEFVEFRFRQQRTLGAKVPNPEQARALVDLITARVNGSKPTALCLDPAASIIRKLDL